MANKKTTKRALLMSVMSMLICVVMLIGTTFAWFTDSVTSGKNTITAGNLDVELEYSKNMTDWYTVEEATDIFTNNLWEPGHAEVVYLRLKNAGTLDVKYQLSLDILSENTATNVYDKPFRLSSHLMFGLVDCDAAFGGRSDAVAAVSSVASPLAGHFIADSMLDGESRTLALVVYMPETVGNEANYKTGTEAPTIELGLNLFATQLMSESDSFDNTYDAGAPWTGDVDTSWYFADPTASEFVIKTAGELAGLAALVNGTATAPAVTFSADAATTVQESFKGKTIKLGNNIDLNDKPWTPIGDNAHPFLGDFDGNGYTVGNIYVDNSGWAGLIGHAGKGGAVTIKNVNVADVIIKSNRMAGALVGQLYGNIDNCHATNVAITVVPNAVEGGFDNGDKVGGLVGWIGDNNNNHSLTNSSVKNVNLTAYRDIGGIAGYAAQSTVIDGNTATDVAITVDQITNNYGKEDFNCGAIWGRTGGTGVVEGTNTVENYTASVKYLDNGIQYVADAVTNETILYIVPASYTDTVVNVPEGVTAIGSYAFAYNTNIEKVVLPSTVKTLSDRAFRDTSASEVVLNEGLTAIPYQAFRNALNLTSVTIPSTVTTISKEAFQNSGIKSLTVPATVTTIEYGAMRDMKELETVTIESNATIPGYAFRACTKLKTVILTGDDVTFEKDMIFTNYETGNGSAITVYVANDTVKERLLAADTAATSYGGYTIVVGATTADTSAELAETLNNGEDVVLSNDIEISENVTMNGGSLNGNGNTVDAYDTPVSSDCAITTTGGTVSNLTIVGDVDATRAIGAGSSGTYSLAGDLNIDNVTIDKVMYAINGSGASTANVNVTNSTVYGWLSFSGINSFNFTNCTIGKGNSYDGYMVVYGNTSFTDCTFEQFDMCADDAVAAGSTVEFKNCTNDGKKVTADNFKELFMYPGDDEDFNKLKACTIIVDGVTVTL